MDAFQVEAVYEHGTLKLPRALPLAEGQRVVITIHPTSAAGRLYGILPQTRDPEDLHRFLNDPDDGQWGSRDL